MALRAGDRLGAYEVLTPLGEGGMGEVYRARDSRLKREVALKILPESFATDPDRVARFQREAEVLASLNHPHVAAIYGLEDAPPTGSGHAGPARALVLELVEGETLAERIARGPIPVDEALAIARQVADGLQAAHEQGIIHRDLKPANIKVTPDGVVKILDFGLARLSDPAHAIASSSAATLTSPAPMTGVGMILGTAAYMAPEQAKGRTADKRSDVWAFGCVVYEMLTAKRAFEGEDITDTIAAIMRGEPDWSALPPQTPAAIRALLHRCLERDRGKRIADVAAATFAIDEVASRDPHRGFVPPCRDDGSGRGLADSPRQCITTTRVAFAQVVTGTYGSADVAVASDATTVYVPGGVAGATRTLIWIDRRGQETAIAAPPRAYQYPRLSPDGGRAAIFINDQQSDIWTWTLARSALTRVTFDASIENYPVWTSATAHLGSRSAARRRRCRMLSASGRTGQQNLFAQAIRDLRAAVHRRRWRPVASVLRRRHAPAVGAQRAGAVLSRAGRRVDARRAGERICLERGGTDEAVRRSIRGLRCDSWTHV